MAVKSILVKLLRKVWCLVCVCVCVCVCEVSYNQSYSSGKHLLNRCVGGGGMRQQKMVYIISFFSSFFLSFFLSCHFFFLSFFFNKFWVRQISACPPKKMRHPSVCVCIYIITCVTCICIYVHHHL